MEKNAFSHPCYCCHHLLFIADDDLAVLELGLMVIEILSINGNVLGVIPLLLVALALELILLKHGHFDARLVSKMCQHLLGSDSDVPCESFLEGNDCILTCPIDDELLCPITYT